LHSKIPKIIHYCWFGAKPISELELRCIESWKKFLPNYQLMFWNENTFNLDKYHFAKQAYDKKYYAFVSDVVRVHVLAEYGGIYLDTDYEVFADFEKLLYNQEVILGFENKTLIGTAMMASIARHKIFIDFIEYYKVLSFISNNYDLQITANTSILSKILKQYDINFNGKEQIISNIHVYPREYFFPKKLKGGKFIITERTKAIHYFEASWLTNRQKRRGLNIFWIEVCRPLLRTSNKIVIKVFGNDKAIYFENKIRNLLK
jgi:mannosyltransferase OCH1-like enzyme